VNITIHDTTYRVRTEKGRKAVLLALAMLDTFREAA
jgi:hypothetical protein